MKDIGSAPSQSKQITRENFDTRMQRTPEMQQDIHFVAADTSQRTHWRRRVLHLHACFIALLRSRTTT